MNVLDIDLDFFLDGVAFSDRGARRQPSTDFKPWPEKKVRLFLEDRVGLSVDKPVNGRVVINHDSAFDFWGHLVESGKLSVPFDITHIDGHSDLGLGCSGYVYLMTELLKINPINRFAKVKRDEISCGDYLAFAIACRWVSKLHWICHPRDHDDLPKWHFKIIKPRSAIIQLRRIASDAFDRLITGASIDFNTPPGLEFEPEVPFRMQSWRSLKTSKHFDYIVLSESPGFTPQESDNLIPIIKEYIRQIQVE